MPTGKPNYTSVICYPKISELAELQGKKVIRVVLFVLIKQFCSSLNVVRNMNEDQIIEVSDMLLEECGNFRLEDYVMMFSMAKKGQLIKIYDRIDMQVVTDIMDSYWQKRHEAGIKAQEQTNNQTERLLTENRNNEKNYVWDENKGYVEKKTDAEKIVSVASALEKIKDFKK